MAAPSAPSKVDIEHATVLDDPRTWLNARKRGILLTVSGAAMIGTLGSNLYNPAISQIESDLHATSGQISLSLSLFIVIQGTFPLIWSAISEIQGRKGVYLVAVALCTMGCIVAATAKSIGVLLGMRCLQAAGSSAAIAIGAATLADIYEPSERGAMMGLYYGAPLLGPSLGPLIGGALTQGFNWRATFWFLAIFTGLFFVAFLFFKDTFRRERSLTYQQALKRIRDHQAAESSKSSSMTHVSAGPSDMNTKEKISADIPEAEQMDAGNASDIADEDVEAQKISSHKDAKHIREIKLSLRDVNPIRPLVNVLRRPNNLAILFASGLLFAFSYSITYTCSRTLANEYQYDALKIGLVLLAFGVGSVLGSVLGGRWSDHVFRQLKDQNGGVSSAEMRLQSVWIPALLLPPFVIAYGWVCEKHVHVAAICVMLFFSGFFSIFIYSSTLAYIVDANVGRSSSAVASNSCFRGVSAFVAAEVAVPLQSSIGDGGLYSLWGGLMIVSELLILLVWWKGKSWREVSEAKEALRDQ